LRTRSYHCPHCKAFLWFLSLNLPKSEKVDCDRCGKPFLLNADALADAWRHVIACWGFLIGAAFFGITSLLRLEFRALLMAPFLAFGVAVFAYVLAIPFASQATNRILANSAGHERFKRVKSKTYD